MSTYGGKLFMTVTLEPFTGANIDRPIAWIEAQRLPGTLWRAPVVVIR